MNPTAVSTPSEALTAFDALEPTQSVVLAFDHDPREVLSRLQAERKGLYEWSPLEEGPKTWRIELLRRDAIPGALRRVYEALSWDHDRLDTLEAKAFEARAAGNLETAAETYAVFAHGLRRHIRFEEDLLFPEFEARAGFPADAGPTAVMRMEHQEILSLLGRIGDGIADPSAPVESARHALHQVLGGHNIKEENVVYPGVDRLMTETESDDLVKRIQSLR